MKITKPSLAACKAVVSMLLLSVGSAYGFSCYTQICINNTSTDQTFYIAADKFYGSEPKSEKLPPAKGNWGPYCIQYYSNDFAGQGCPKVRFALYADSDKKTQILGALVNEVSVTEENRYNEDKYPVDGPHIVYRGTQECEYDKDEQKTVCKNGHREVILYNVGYTPKAKT